MGPHLWEKVLFFRFREVRASFCEHMQHADANIGDVLVVEGFQACRFTRIHLRMKVEEPGFLEGQAQ